MTNELLPTLVDLTAEAFAMRHSVRAVTWADHISHLEGVATHVWQSIPCERVRKLSAGGRDLAFRGLTFVPPYCAV